MAGAQTTVKSAPEKLPKTSMPPASFGGKMIYVVGNIQGVGKREQQEDSFGFGNALDTGAIDRQGLMAVVADGMGGMKNGKLASDTAVSVILDAFRRMDLRSSIPQQLQDAAIAAGDRVLDQLQGSGGSTLVAGLFYQEMLWTVSVGDSYIFLLHDRKLVRLNHSQNVLSRDSLELIMNGSMDRTEVLRSPEKDAITHFLGMPGLDETDLLRSPLKLSAGDVLMFCSDGVGGFLSERYIEECLLERTPKEMCDALEAGLRSRDHKYQDNYTALVVQCRR
ncbi:MAG: protein phosphatase 2C domain-containing protein [Oscillospiraceae bacterium]|nr:protein phosphatase 2C domain-containing protein [Oscillospiraceae bacterium]